MEQMGPTLPGTGLAEYVRFAAIYPSVVSVN